MEMRCSMDESPARGDGGGQGGAGAGDMGGPVEGGVYRCVAGIFVWFPGAEGYTH